MSTRSTPFAVRALYEYDVEQDDDLPFEPGQIIHVTEVCDDQWYFGYYETNGSKLEGMFPRNYVEDAPVTKPIASEAPVKVNQSVEKPASSPELPPVPQPQVRAAAIEDDWGSDGSADEDQESHKPLKVAKESVVAPVTETVPSSDVVPGRAPPQAASPPTKVDTNNPVSKNLEQLSLEEKQTETPVSTKSASKPAAIEDSDRQMPDITPGESLSSNFKSRRGIFDQKEEEPDTTKPLTKTRTNPQKLQRWQPQEEEAAPSRSTFAQKTNEEEAAPRVSIKERLAMIQKQEQEMQQREENEKKRREQEDEQLRQEESRRIREEEEANAARESSSIEEKEEEAPVGPIEGHTKPPSIPVLPRVSETQAQEPRVAGSFEDDEEGARKIALRERMARIQGLGNSGGISLGMMLGRNPDASQAGGATRTRRPKKKDVSAMSDLERELYLASVEYDQMHGAEDEAEEGVQEEKNIPQPTEIPEERDIADDETLIGARDTDAETLAESDTEPESHRHLPAVVGNPSSVPVQAPAQPSPLRVPSSSQKTPVGASGAPPVPTLATAHEGRAEGPAAEAVHAHNLEAKPAHAPPPLAHAPAPAPPVPSASHATSGSPPVPKDLPHSLDNFEDPAGTDTTALAADEGSSSSSSSDDEYSDATAPNQLPTLPASTHSTAPLDRAKALRQHDLHARIQSDNETGYEADADTDDPSRQSEADMSGSNLVVPPQHSDARPTAPVVPPVPATKRAPPQVPTSAPAQNQSPGQPQATRAPPSVPVRHPAPPAVPGQVRSPPPIPGQAPPVPTAVPRAAPPPPQPGAPLVPPQGSVKQAPHIPDAPPKVPRAPQSPPVPHAPAPIPTPVARAAPQVPSAPAPAPAQVPPSPSQTSPPISPTHHNKVAPAAPTDGSDEHKGHRRKQPSTGGSEIDLDLHSLWFTKEHGLPASIDPTKVVAESEHQESNKRGRVIVTHDVYVLYSDLSQLHIEVKYDKAEPGQAHGTQKYIAPPKVDSTELVNSAKTIGAKIASAVSHHTEITHTSAFVKSLFQEVPEALPPIKGSFGLSIYENFGGASVNQIDSIYPGDIVVLVQANFQSSKSALTSPLQKHHHKKVANSVYVVQEWDGSKKKLRVFDTKKESFRLGELTSGMVKIYRPVARGIVGW